MYPEWQQSRIVVTLGTAPWAAEGVGEATLELRQLLGRDAAEVVRLALFEIERHDELVVDRQPGGLAGGEVGPHDPPAVPGVVHDHCVVRSDRGDETLEPVEDPGAGGVLAGAHLDVAEPAASEHLGHQGDVGVAAGEAVGLAADEQGTARAGAFRLGLVPHPDSVPSGGLAASPNWPPDLPSTHPPPRRGAPMKHPLQDVVVVLPGIMGSALADESGHEVWEHLARHARQGRADGRPRRSSASSCQPASASDRRPTA